MLLDAEVDVLNVLEWDCQQGVSFNTVLEILSALGFAFSTDKIV